MCASDSFDLVCICIRRVMFEHDTSECDVRCKIIMRFFEFYRPSLEVSGGTLRKRYSVIKRLRIPVPSAIVQHRTPGK